MIFLQKLFSIRFALQRKPHRNNNICRTQFKRMNSGKEIAIIGDNILISIKYISPTNAEFPTFKFILRLQIHEKRARQVMGCNTLIITYNCAHYECFSRKYMDTQILRCLANRFKICRCRAFYIRFAAAV